MACNVRCKLRCFHSIYIGKNLADRVKAKCIASHAITYYIQQLDALLPQSYKINLCIQWEMHHLTDTGFCTLQVKTLLSSHYFISPNSQIPKFPGCRKCSFPLKIFCLNCIINEIKLASINKSISVRK